ncbi:MAG: extracellular solute-binding protein [Clostridia bacterium]|nr:extracellular solute-binding protein [Clostridia bacterium]
MKRLLICIVVIVLTVGMAAGAEDPMLTAVEAYHAYDPIDAFEPPIDVYTVNYVTMTAAEMKNSLWLDVYREYLGVNLIYKWIMPLSQFDNRVNAEISSGDIPDILPVNFVQLSQLIDAGLIEPLTDVWEDGASDLTKRMYELGGCETSFRAATRDGELWAIPLVTPVKETTRAMYLRQDWMDNLGMDAPTNLEELLELCEAFATNDPDGDGRDNTYAIALYSGLWGDYTADLSGFANSFGAYPTIWIEKDGQIEYGGIQPECKEMLAVLADWYQAGYIDKDFTLYSLSDVMDQFARGKYGFMYGTHIAMLEGGQVLYRNNPDFDSMIVALPDVGTDGYPALAYDNTGSYYVVRKGFEHPEVLVQLFNIIHYFASASSEGLTDKDMDLTWWDENLWTGGQGGRFPWNNAYLRPETIHNNIERSYIVQKALETGAPEDIDAALSTGLGRVLYEEAYTHMTQGDQMRLSDDPVTLLAASENWLHAKRYYHYKATEEAYGDNLVTDKRGGIITDSIVDYWESLYTLQLTTYTQIITGEKDVDDFDSFVEAFYQMGGDIVTADINDAYYAK